MDPANLPTMQHVLEKTNLALKPTGEKGIVEATYAQYVVGWDKVPEDERKRVITTLGDFVRMFLPSEHVSVKTQQHANGALVIVRGPYQAIAYLAAWNALDDSRTFSALTFHEGRSVTILTRLIQRQLNLQDSVQQSIREATPKSS